MKERFNRNIPSWIGVIVICVGSIGLVSMHTEYRYMSLHTENTLNKTHIDEINQSLNSLKDTLGILENKNNTISSTLENERNKNGTLFEQFNDITNTVDTLQKLAKTDPQLLQKYSKVYFLNENYIPAELNVINSEYTANPKTKFQIHAKVAPHLETLLQDAENAGLHLQILSAYRSFGTQAALKSSYKVIYGTTKANQFSADQGYSEHQLGTAVDFTTASTGNTFSKFEKTPEYAWLLANAYKYGFILSYPETNKFYTYEPWHWRFVGIGLATRLQHDGLYFYAADQRDINSYLATMFD